MQNYKNCSGKIEEHDKRFRVLTWPAYSPNLNPIKHLWDMMDRQVWSMHATGTLQLTGFQASAVNATFFCSLSICKMYQDWEKCFNRLLCHHYQPVIKSYSCCIMHDWKTHFSLLSALFTSHCINWSGWGLYYCWAPVLCYKAERPMENQWWENCVVCINMEQV